MEGKILMDSLKTKVNYHIDKLFGLQQSGNIENCEEMEEFDEEDIWGSLDAETSEQVSFRDNGCNCVESCRSMKKERNYKNSRRSMKSHRKESYHEDNRRYQSSAPLNIPDWSKMVWEDKRNKNWWRKNHEQVEDDDNSDDNYEAGDSERNIMIPPHEFIAKQLAQGEITSFSVYEGIGRTLRGRDAVWTITGFVG